MLLVCGALRLSQQTWHVNIQNQEITKEHKSMVSIGQWG
jgi:hypothetical protein